MVPKIRAALSKFVTPIQTASAGSSAHQQEFVRTQPQRKAKVLPFKGAAREQTSQEQPSDQRPDGDQSNPEVSPQSAQLPAARRDLGVSFFALCDSLRGHRSSIFKWIGMRGYRLGMLATRRGGKLRKGAMLDTLIE